MYKHPRICLLAFFLMCFFVVDGQLPSYMKACHRNDPNLDDCVLKVARESTKRFSKGDKERGFLRTDPMKIKEIKTAAFGSRNTGINLHFIDVSLKGLRNLDMRSFHIDLKNRYTEIKCIANLTLESKYDLKGRLLIFPLVGNGNALINMQNVKFKFSLRHGFETKDGVEYPTVKHTELKHDIESIKIKLDNLFNGDKVLGDTTNRLLNENWKEVVAEIGGPIVEEIRKQLHKMTAVLFSQVPYDQMFLPD